ncbi:MAG: carboxylesterase family protein, partial [Pirellula sp.]
ARTVSAARDLRGEKTPEEAQEELIARKTIIEFFTKHFTRQDAKTDPPSDPSNQEKATQVAPANNRQEDRARGGADFKRIAGANDKITREAFKNQLGNSGALASRPELADRLFDRLDTDRDGSLSETEFEGFSQLKSQFGRSGQTARPGPNPGQNNSANQADLNQGTAANSTASPIRITAGELVGQQFGDVRVYLGIPYAAAPIANGRWQAPEPARKWNGVLKATQFGTPALQGETFAPRSSQSEDCLFLNGWTPANVRPDSKLPVLFWIHGGAFIQGSGAQPRYDGTELAKRGAIVITINYRLGPLGLFAHPALTAESKPDQPLANYCLLDMIAALRWTKENIAAFGGDPNNVTISGSSAGGTSCLFLMGIPQARGLFHKAIIHSSGGIQNIQTLAEAEEAGVRLAQRLGLGQNPTSSELRRVPSNDLAAGVGLVRQLNLPVKPIIDGRLVSGVPADTFAQGKQAKIPVLIGSSNGESGARQLGDELATGGAFGFQRKLADDMVRSGQTVWMFQLTYVQPTARQNRFAASHGETVAYAFGTIGKSLAAQYGFRNDQVAEAATRSRRVGGNRQAVAGREDDSQPVEDSEQGRKISEAMMEYWVTFMREGEPSGKNLPDWPKHDLSLPKAMVFGNQGIAAR